MTSGVDWVEDHRDPDSLGLPADRLLRHRRWRLARAAGRGAARRRRPAPGVSTARPTPRCSTGCASGPPAAPYAEALRALWRDLGCTRDAFVARRRRRASRWPAAASPRPPATGPGSALLAVDGAAGGERLLDPDWVAGGRARRRTRSSAPAGCPAASPRTPASATTGGRWTTTGRRVTADGSRGQFALRRPRPRRRRGQDLGVALRRLPRRTGRPATSAISACARSPAASRTPDARPSTPTGGSTREPQRHDHLRPDRGRRHRRPLASTCR